MSEVAAEVARHAHGRVPRELRERQLLEVAEELFAERGYDAVSMDEIATRAGVTKPVIYGLVGNKEELFRRCLRRAGDELARRVAGAVRAEDEPKAQLQAGMTAFFALVAERPGAWELFVAGRDGRFSDETNAIFARQSALVAQLMSDIVEVSPLQAEAAAYAINGASEALTRWWTGHPEIPPETMARSLVELVWPGLDALRPA